MVTVKAEYPLTLTDGDRKLPLGVAVVWYVSEDGAPPRDVFLGAILAARRRYRALLAGLELRNIWRISSGTQQYPLDELAIRPRDEDLSGGKRKWLTPTSAGIKRVAII